MLDLSPEHYSRCETGSKTLSTGNEKMYRMFAFLASAPPPPDEDDKRELTAEQASQAKDALEAFRKLFFDMKIENIYAAGSQLEFAFCRRRREERGCGDDKPDDDGKWQKAA